MKYLKLGDNLGTLQKSYLLVQSTKALVGLCGFFYFTNFITKNQYNYYVGDLTLIYFLNALASVVFFNIFNKEIGKFIPFVFSFTEVIIATYFIHKGSFLYNTIYFWGFAVIASNYFFTNIKATAFNTVIYAGYIGANFAYNYNDIVISADKSFAPTYMFSLVLFGFYNFFVYLLIEKYRRGYVGEMKMMTNYNRSLIDSIPGFVSWVNADLEYIGVNKNMCEFFGKSEEYFLGTKIGELTENDQSRLKFMVTQFIKSNKRETQDKLTYVFQGKTFHSILSMVKYGDGVLIVTFDVTKIIEAEDLINIERERAQTSARLASFGEVSAGIAHEINNPLAVISAINYKLKRLKSKGELSDELIDEFNQKVDKQITLISKIVKSIKTLSRDGHSDPFENKSLLELVDEVKILVEPKCKGKNIDIHFPENTEDFYLDCQGVQIGQVLIIMLNNAVDAIKELDNKWIRFTVSDHSHGYEFVIEDSGKGIPKDIADNIFMPFFTTKSVGEGTGLGLSLAVKIIKLHGGEIRVDHTASNTKFVIYLPKQQMKLAS